MMPVPLKRGTRPPWVGLAAAVWVQIAGGTGYNFPLYSHSLKSVMGFSQWQLAMLGVANDIGENVGILPGLAMNKFQPWVVLLIGALHCFFGYGILWLAFTKTLDSVPFCVLWFALCIGTNGSAWFSTTVLVTNMNNFPLSRGIVAGILKGYSGLGAAVYTEVYSVLLNNSSSKLLLFIALGIPALCLMMMFFVRACTPASGDDPTEHHRFHFIQVFSISLGIEVLLATTLDNWFSLGSLASYFFLLVMMLLLMAPFAIPVMMTFYGSGVSQSALYGHEVGSGGSLSVQEDGNSNTTGPLLESSSPAANIGTYHQSDGMSEVEMLLAKGVPGGEPRGGQNFTLCQALVEADFWLLFLVYFVGVGSGVTVLNNLAQIGIAQNFDNIKVLLSVFSFFNFLGRLGGGAVSELYARSKAIPRTIWMTITQVIMVITYYFFASALNGTVLMIATSVLGVCYGFQFSVMVSTASELFGLMHFGTIFNFISIGNPLGAYLFSTSLAGTVYDNEAARQHSRTCVGPNCFRLTFIILAVVCIIGTVLSVVLTVRLGPVYQNLHSKERPQAESSNQ